MRRIHTALQRCDDGGLGAGFFIDVLRRHYSGTEARAQLDTAIAWGRCAELYAYDGNRGELTLAPAGGSAADGEAS